MAGVAAGRGECKWPVCKRRAFYNIRRPRCDFFSLLRWIVHSKIKVKSARRRDRFLASARPLHGSEKSRTVIGSLRARLYRFKDLFSIFLRDFNDAPPLEPRSKNNSAPLLGEARRFRKAVNIAPKGSRLWPPRETREIAINSTRLSIAIIVSIKPPGLAIPLAKRFRTERGKDTRFTHPFTLFSPVVSSVSAGRFSSIVEITRVWYLLMNRTIKERFLQLTTMCRCVVRKELKEVGRHDGIFDRRNSYRRDLRLRSKYITGRI